MELPKYLKYHNNELYYNNINLLDLIHKEGECLEVYCPELVGEQINSLNAFFKSAIEKYNYDGKYEYFYATKANYQKCVLDEVLKYTNYLETSSKNDISIIEYLFNQKKLNKHTKVICNGFKNEEYFNKIIKLKNQGLNIIPIIENENELNYLLKLDINIEAGIRINIDDEYNKIYKNNECSRFGMSLNEIINKDEIINNSKLNITIFHFHMNNCIKNINQYTKLLKSIVDKKYIPLKKKINTINYLDIGGGMPVSYYQHFNYQLLTNNILKLIKNSCLKYNIKVPNIIIESGAYTVADTKFNIYKMELKKSISKDAYWYILNNSIATLIPDIWITNKSYLVLPINLVNNEYVKVRLSSLTCDNDDKYYFQEGKQYLKMPDVKNNETLFIAFFKTGCYEDNLRGLNTIHHCLIEEPKKILIKNSKISIIKEKQTDQDILNILGYK